jgi:signal peptidase I
MPFNDSDEVDLGFSTKTAGNFTINLQNFDGLFSNQEIFLKDNKRNKVIDLKKASYSFISDKGVFNDRFVLGYRDTFSTLKNKEITPNDIIIFKPNQDLHIDSGIAIMQKIRVFDVRGRILLEKENISATQTTINVGSSNQVLLIEITTNDGITITKKYVN